MNRLAILASTLIVATVAGSLDAALLWFEAGDAGDSLATANQIVGSGSVDAIVGTLPDNDPNNVDMFALVIPDPLLFSASTDNFPDTDLFDSWLYLFDSDGRGVAASATTVGGSFNATISQGSVSGGPGLYYLAVTRFETAPQSASGLIFPDLFLGSTDGQVLGPTGAGGADPLVGWSAPALFDFENYRIDITGATPVPNAAIPEPASICVWAIMSLAGLTFALRKRSRK